MFTMRSKYNGFCITCKKKIFKGQEIAKDEKRDKWVHSNCLNHATSDTVNSLAGINAIPDPEPEPEKEFVPSEYQLAIFDFVENGQGNAVVEAVAGSGKTTTIVKALKLTSPDSRVAFLAFNRHIAKELQRRVPEHVHASTLHSLGFSVLNKLEEKPVVDNDKTGIIMNEIWPIGKEVEHSVRFANRQKRAVARKIVGLAKGTLCDYDNPDALMVMCERYGIDIELNGAGEEILTQIPWIMVQSKRIDLIDYDDMIWLPVIDTRLKNHIDKWDFLFIDEAQDLNACQIQFVLQSLAANGRIIAVGDRKQSLYGFRGADVDAIPRLIKMLNAKTLPLSITYRCPRLITELAQEIVPQIQAADFAKEGEILSIEHNTFMNEVQVGDMVLCRTNAPLIAPAFELIKRGVKAVIRGRDIGRELVTFIERFEAKDLGNLEILMSEYLVKEYNRLLDKQRELAAEFLKDKVETIYEVSRECTTILELTQKLQILFDDSVAGVVFSSIHRAKGLEAENIYVLREELMPHPKARQDWEIEQEWNTKYVCITRALDKLIFVKEEAKL